MAMIQKFEDIISWKEARELNRLLGRIVDSGKLKKNFRLINQIEGSAGSIMDNIAEGFERGGNKELASIYLLQKPLAENCGLNYTGLWTGAILIKTNLIS